jgi:HK97 family phage major capsid protein
MNQKTELLKRRAEIAGKRAEITVELLRAEVPDERHDELIQQRGALDKDYARTETLLALASADEDAARAEAGTPLAGPGSRRREVRAFDFGLSEIPERFAGPILRSQSGEHVPVLRSGDSLAAFLPRTESRAEDLGVGGFLRALYFGPRSETERRVLAEASVGAGGALVPTPLSAAIIDMLTTRAVAFRAGASLIPMTSQTLRGVKVVGMPEGAWRAENAPIVEDQPAFGDFTLRAHTWALLVRVSRELLEDAINLDATLRSVFATTASLALDKAVLFGSGTDDEPLGLANQPGVQTISMGVNGGTLTGWGKILDAALALETANAGDITAIVAAPRTGRALYGASDSTGQPLQTPPRLAGVPVLTTTSLPVDEAQGTAANASSVFLGDWREVLVGMRTQLQISVLQERYADNGQIGFVLWMRGDVQMARPASMARIVGVTP